MVETAEILEFFWLGSIEPPQDEGGKPKQPIRPCPDVGVFRSGMKIPHVTATRDVWGLPDNILVRADT